MTTDPRDLTAQLAQLGFRAGRDALADSWRDRHSFERDDSPEKPPAPLNRPAKKR